MTPCMPHCKSHLAVLGEHREQGYSHQVWLPQAMRRTQQTLSPVPVAAMLSAGAASAPPPPASPFAQPAESLAGLRGDTAGLAAPAAAAAPGARRLPVSPFQGAKPRWLAEPGRPAEDPFPLSEVRTGSCVDTCESRRSGRNGASCVCAPVHECMPRLPGYVRPYSGSHMCTSMIAFLRLGYTPMCTL